MKTLLAVLSFTLISLAHANNCSLDSKLMKRINADDANKVAKYLKRHIELKTPDCLGKILINTIKSKKKLVSNYLITQNANLNLKDNNETALIVAINLKDYYMASSLLAAGASAHQTINTNEGEVKLIDHLVKTNTQFTYINLLKKYGAKETLDCSLKNSMIPKCYHKRNKAVLKIALVYYGDHMKMEDLNRIEPILKKRFSIATQKNVEVDIISKKVISFKHKIPADYTYNNITDRARLQRIWYYDNVGAKVMEEVYQEYKKQASDKLMDELDAIVAITGAQFDGLGFASGRVSVTEYPREIAWNLEDGGRVDYISDYQIVDELIHELGHNMFLGHTASQCSQPGMTLEARNECCSQSPSKDDVLSYCRNRNAVNADFMHGFESCNIDMIENLVVPAMLAGDEWQVAPRTTCE